MFHLLASNPRVLTTTISTMHKDSNTLPLVHHSNLITLIVTQIHDTTAHSCQVSLEWAKALSKGHRESDGKRDF